MSCRGYGTIVQIFGLLKSFATSLFGKDFLGSLINSVSDGIGGFFFFFPIKKKIARLLKGLNSLRIHVIFTTTIIINKISAVLEHLKPPYRDSIRAM